jgi:hypothetical protein
MIRTEPMQPNLFLLSKKQQTNEKKIYNWG